MAVQTIPPIEDMTLAQQVELMELLWDHLIRTSRRVPSIEWHRQILDDGERKFEGGEAGYLDWEEAKAKVLSKLESSSLSDDKTYCIC
jgi:Putative addiction module component